MSVIALGPSSGRVTRSHPRRPMPSPGASAAWDICVDEVRATLAAHGFTVAQTGYGVLGIREEKVGATTGRMDCSKPNLSGPLREAGA